MLISDFDYILPEEKIAKFAPKTRGSTRLLVFDRQNGTIIDNYYKNLDQYLEAGDLVILNDTKVIPAKLLGFKNPKQKKQINQESSRGIEILLTEFHSDYQEKLESQEWNVVYRGKIKVGDEIEFSDQYRAKVIDILLGGIAKLRFNCNPIALAQEVGDMPIPPYLKRDSTIEDVQRYQTEFGLKDGSVAAPTASLNFTNELKDRLIKKGVKVVYLTLHVGLGTFLPVRTDIVSEHQMHSEYFEIPVETILEIKKAKKLGKKILAVGTTVCRTLEYASDEIQKYKPNNQVEKIIGEADIFIYPGYEFKLIDALLTNFHAPRSTPLLLVSAFTGFELLLSGYDHALKHDYSFLSFGDSCLII